MESLREKTIRGGFAKVLAQAAHFALRFGSLVVFARLLEPRDFGLVAMVTAVIGVLNLFRDFGLSTATVQQTSVTHEQLSTLFWINMLVGAALASLAVAAAPLIAGFYQEPRLFWVTVALSAAFVFNAAGVQHSALLQRQMRFRTIAAIEIASVVINISVGIGMALAGLGYWALVGMGLAAPLVSSTLVWLATAWVPGMPRRNIGLRSMLRFGGTVTLNGLVVYVAYNLEKVLLGRFWGAEPLAYYERAYQIANIPTENLNSAVGGVAFAAMARVKEDPARLRNYFLTAYALMLGATVPITLLGTVFANELVLLLLGPKWSETVPIFRLLAPTILIFAIINPFYWLLISIGMSARSLKIALVISPLVISAYIIGLPYGPQGVALSYSSALALFVVPCILWCVWGTVISVSDIILTVSRPLISGIVATILPLAMLLVLRDALSPFEILVAGSLAFMAVYAIMLLHIFRQKALYLDLLRTVTKGNAIAGEFSHQHPSKGDV